MLLRHRDGNRAAGLSMEEGRERHRRRDGRHLFDRLARRPRLRRLLGRRHQRLRLGDERGGDPDRRRRALDHGPAREHVGMPRRSRELHRDGDRDAAAHLPVEEGRHRHRRRGLGDVLDSARAVGRRGAYSVAVTDACGSLTSDSATLTIDDAPSITAQPAGLTTLRRDARRLHGDGNRHGAAHLPVEEGRRRHRRRHLPHPDPRLDRRRRRGRLRRRRHQRVRLGDERRRLVDRRRGARRSRRSPRARRRATAPPRTFPSPRRERRPSRTSGARTAPTSAARRPRATRSRP